ncbi:MULTISPECIES: entericidin A/B family lipoprotein [Paraburkholderia]|nr:MULTISPECIES: entericidin A/B family lipoprotein [Paraburkholderia]MCX4164100.1 entericidin A/B family lipoprotein [Paraburkholderia megapolitana]MDN7159594.1 entericidin A/B family lipoprotein [Paraburkholderia sp. CHISQ3]MDQ6496641.1 entericidin A/B family lipoprotein [Paraburkholderia megapolitana]
MNTSTLWRRTVLLALTGMLLGLAGCNTVAGFGQDMDDAGHAIKKAAD